MNKLRLSALAALFLALDVPATCVSQVRAQNFPLTIRTGLQDKFHVQGIAYDRKRDCMYMSFTTSLVKVDMQGRVLGSVEGLTGHLGCISLNPDDGRLYGSLEYKHDAIGQGIMDGMGGVRNDNEDGFYIAVFDVARINREHMNAQEVMTTVYVRPAVDDFNAEVTNQGRTLRHRFGCSGIDGLTLAPRWGKGRGRRMLYVAYGIYSENDRTDNDYQVLLCYDVDKLRKHEQTLVPQNLHHSGPKKADATYYIHTGNTCWGVQNLCYDSHTGHMLAAVYPGKKPGWKNFGLYVADGQGKPTREVLKGVEPRTTGLVMPLLMQGEHDPAHDTWGWNFKWGSTGLVSLGDGRFYVSVGGRDKATGRQYCEARLFRWEDQRGLVPVE
ncbi:MAG TPA: hypothetical protein DDW22_04035 [Prevotellaceae bacterium]|nr:hypothetical protein [Prevotellaceae bacterium]